MLSNPDRLQYLFRQYTGKTASLTEVQELFEVIDDLQQRENLQRIIDEDHEALRQIGDSSGIDWDDMFSRIMQRKVVDIRTRRRILYRYVAAAAAVLAFI